MQYRSEVDGLRALAVLPVIFFHAGFPVFAGGFVGVDIFFVISGYLITTLIIKERQEDNFSLRVFYERRARRLLPALFLVMLLSIPFAYILMWPNDLENFGQSLVATTIFSNNILLYLTSSNYWDISSEFKPLLHTWSLGVEEQYYIIFPVLIAMIWSFGLRKILYIFILIGLCSLLFSVSLSNVENNQPANFFLLPSRFWQILIGACCAIFMLINPRILVAKIKFRQYFSIAAILAIFVSFFTFEANNYPNLMALIPTMATGMLILFAAKDTFIGKVLSSKILVGIGLMSYSLYLWHQPIFAFLRISSIQPPPNILYFLSIISIFILAAFSLRIEKIFRDWTLVTSKLFFIIMAISGSALILVGLIFHLTSGFYNQHQSLNSNQYNYSGLTLQPEEFYNLNDGSHLANNSMRDKIISLMNPENKNSKFLNLPFIFLDKPFTDANKKNILIYGDSFARDFINMINVNSKFLNFEISFVKNTCFEIDHPNQLDKPKFFDEADIIFISYRILSSEADFLCFQIQLNDLLSSGKEFYIIGTKGFGYNMNAPFKANLFNFKAPIPLDILDFNNRIQSMVPSNNFINLLDLIAEQDETIALYTKERKFISSDGYHLTYEGAEHVGEILFKNSILSSINQRE